MAYTESEQEITFFLGYAPLLDLKLGTSMVGVSAQQEKKLLKLQEKRRFLILLEFRVIKEHWKNAVFLSSSTC